MAASTAMLLELFCEQQVDTTVPQLEQPQSPVHHAIPCMETPSRPCDGLQSAPDDLHPPHPPHPKSPEAQQWRREGRAFHASDRPCDPVARFEPLACLYRHVSFLNMLDRSRGETWSRCSRAFHVLRHFPRPTKHGTSRVQDGKQPSVQRE